MKPTDKHTRDSITKEVVEILNKEGHNITKDIANIVFSKYLDVTASKLGKFGDPKTTITFVGTLRFQGKDISAKIGRNPLTGKEIQLPARRKYSIALTDRFKEKILSLI